MRTKSKSKRTLALTSMAIALAVASIVNSSAASPSVKREYTPGIMESATSLISNANIQGIGSQPATGKSVTDIAYSKGRIYLGYGDYTNNTGPIDLYSYNTSGTDPKKEITVPSEAIMTIEEINGALYVPFTDPKAEWNDPSSGYASNRDGSWKLYPVGPMIHGFDMASTNGTNLYMAGSTVQNGKKVAAIWYSADGVSNWSVIRTLGETPSNSPQESDRYYWLEASGGKLYASAVLNNTTQRTLDVWDGSTWKSSPIDSKFDVYNPSQANLMGDVLWLGSHPYSVTENRELDLSEITNVSPAPFNESNAVSSGNGSFYRSGNVLYSFDEDSRIYSTTDGRSWKTVADYTSSVALSRFAVDTVNGDVFFVGRSSSNASSIRKAKFPATYNAPPEVNLPSETVSIPQNGSWDPMAGVTGTDDRDGTVAVTHEGGTYVDAKTPGSYTVIYTAKDKNTASTRVTLTVQVQGSSLIGGDRSSMCVKAKSTNGPQVAYAGGSNCAL